MLAMNTGLNAEKPENIVSLGIHKPKPAQRKQRFKITEFINPSGVLAFRVSGYDREGQQIRENFKDEAGARCRQVELECEYLQQSAQTAIRATRLTDEQLRLAEDVIRRAGDDWERLMDMFEHWKRTGAKSLPDQSPRIDDAVDQYVTWLAKSDLRDATKRHWKTRLTIFRN